MMTAFFTLLSASLLTILPSPVTPHVTGRLTTSDIMDGSHLYDMDDVLDVFRDSGRDHDDVNDAAATAAAAAADAGDDDDLSSVQNLARQQNMGPFRFRFPTLGPLGSGSGSRSGSGVGSRSGSDWERFQPLHPRARVQDSHPSATFAFPILAYRRSLAKRVHAAVDADRSEETSPVSSPKRASEPFGLLSDNNDDDDDNDDLFEKRWGPLPIFCHMLNFPMSRGCLQKVERKSAPNPFLFGGALGR